MGESHIDHRLAGILTGVEGATLHFRTSMPVNHVKLVVRDADAEAARATVDKVDAEIRKRIGPGIYGVDGETFVGRDGQGAAGAGGDAGVRRVVHRAAWRASWRRRSRAPRRSSAAASSPTPTR